MRGTYRYWRQYVANLTPYLKTYHATGSFKSLFLFGGVIYYFMTYRGGSETLEG